jgi:hypothetical protein
MVAASAASRAAASSGGVPRAWMLEIMLRSPSVLPIRGSWTT